MRRAKKLWNDAVEALTGIIALFAAICIFAFVWRWAWNCAVPVTSLPVISYWQSVALLVMARVGKWIFVVTSRKEV